MPKLGVIYNKKEGCFYFTGSVKVEDIIEYIEKEQDKVIIYKVSEKHSLEDCKNDLINDIKTILESYVDIDIHQENNNNIYESIAWGVKEEGELYVIKEN